MLPILYVLKTKLQTATDFSDVFTYFFDNVSDDPEMMDRGHPVERHVLKQVLTHVAQAMLLNGPRLYLKRAMLIYLPDQEFIHGPLEFKGHMANMFYFEDIDLGMLALISTPPKGDTLFARFSCKGTFPGSPDLEELSVASER